MVFYPAAQVLQPRHLAFVVRQVALVWHALDRTGPQRREFENPSQCQFDVQTYSSHSSPLQSPQYTEQTPSHLTLCIQAKAHETTERTDILAKTCSCHGA